MKNLIILLLFVSIQATAQRQLPALLKGGSESPSFSYTECLNNLKGKDRYCSRYDYTLYIKDNELIIIITTNRYTDQPKKTYSYSSEYRVKLDDIALNVSLKELKTSNDKSSIKDMEGNKQRFYAFDLQSKFVDGIKTTERGVPVGKESIYLYADSYTDARDFLEYLLAVTY